MAMATIVDVPRDTAALDAVMRLVLPCQRMRIQLEEPLSDEAFRALCARNKGFSIEQDPDGTLTLTSPTGGTSGIRNFHIYQPDTLRTTLDCPDTVTAETVVNGFSLPMKRIWDPLAE